MFKRILIIILMISMFSGCFDSVDILTSLDTDKHELVVIPEGEFWYLERIPRSNLYIYRWKKIYTNSYFISKYEVTIGEYLDFMNQTGYEPEIMPDAHAKELVGDPPKWGWASTIESLERKARNNHITRAYLKKSYPHNYPAIVTHADAQAYAKWKGGRLPTDIEWEKAARGGLEKKEYSFGDTVKRGDGSFWYNDELINEIGRRRMYSPVGSYNPNGYGLYDVTGNALEFCSDHPLLTRGGAFWSKYHIGHSRRNTEEYRQIKLRIRLYLKGIKEAGFRIVID